MATSETDEQLVRKSQQGDERAFGGLVNAAYAISQAEQNAG